MCHPVPYVYLLLTQRNLHAWADRMACKNGTAYFISRSTARSIKIVPNPELGMFASASYIGRQHQGDFC